MEWKKYVIENYLEEKEGEYELLKPLIREKVFKELTSDEESKILRAAKILIGLDDLKFTKEQASYILNKCSNLQKLESISVRDYRLDVEIAIKFIFNFQNGAECKCEIYEKWIQFIPEREVEIGYLTLLGQPFVNIDKYQTEYDLECRICNTKWRANRNDAYHYPTYEWIKK